MIRSNGALLTDLYQLTMLQAYFDQKMNDEAVFEFFVRRLPAGRQFLLAAGLEQALDYLENLSFSAAELEWLTSSGRFTPDFVESLSRFRFTGDVLAMPEGTPFFPDEPVLRVVAPLAEAQLVESRLINILQFQTLIASKAARCVLAAPDRLLVDFGMRRAHGAEAGLLAARATYLAGFAGTATVQAGQYFGIPLFGTMAHSFILAHDDESLAFDHFAQSNPNNVVLLLDTYDTEAAARKLIPLAERLQRLFETGSAKIQIQGVRLDSGDLAQHARDVRKILDEGGLNSVTIFASGNLDEYKLHELIQSGAPIDGFGVGSRLDVSVDVPYLDCVYKLQEYAGRPRRKRSEGKATWPGRKQVYRQTHNGVITGDRITLEDHPQPGEPLLRRVMQNGKRIEPSKPLSSIRTETFAQLRQLPEPLCGLEDGQPYPVVIAEPVHELTRQLDAT